MGENKTKLALICYGNILRSQVLEQFLRYYSKDYLEFFSAGVAGSDEFPDEKELLDGIGCELDKRCIPHRLCRNTWNENTAKELLSCPIILCADSSVRDTVSKRLEGSCYQDNLSTFYEYIGEGEKDFEDTYDYEKKRQDPVRFAKAFDEIERIAKKILEVSGIPL